MIQQNPLLFQSMWEKSEDWYRERWNSATLGRRVQLAMDAVWITGEGKLTKLGERITQEKWEKLSLGAQNVLKRKEARG